MFHYRYRKNEMQIFPGRLSGASGEAARVVHHGTPTSLWECRSIVSWAAVHPCLGIPPEVQCGEQGGGGDLPDRAVKR